MRTERVGAGRAAMCGALLFLAGAMPSDAFHIRMELEPQALEMGESAELSIVIQTTEAQQPQAPELPSIAGLRFGRPATEFSFSRTMINGVSEHRRFTTYRYSVIPLQPGEYTIGPYTYVHEGNAYELPARTLRVVAPGGGEAGKGQVHELSDLVFAKLSVDKERVYVHEAFTLTISIFSRGLNLGRDMSLMNMPDTGINMQPFQELRTTREIVGDHVYDVRRYQAQIRPITAGTIRLSPGLRVQLLVPRSQQRGRHPFDDPFFRGIFSNMEAHPHDLELEPLQVTVRSVPDRDRPDAFTGGVGAFDFDVRVQPTEVRPGDPITVTMIIEGEGNMDAVAAPSISDSELFRVYPPRLTSKDLDRSLSRGRKLYEQVIIPRTAEAAEVPSLQFSYFDPERERFETVTRGPFTLVMAEGEAVATRVVRGDGRATDHQARIVGQDIRYLKPAPARWVNVQVGVWYRQPAFLALQAVPPVLVLAVFILARRRRALDADVARARRYRAPRRARPGLKQAERALRNGNADEFHDGLWAALTAYFGDRFNLSPGSVTSDTVLAELERQGMDAESLASVGQLFGACEQRRFAHVAAGPEQMASLLETCRRVLKTCERMQT